MFKNDIPVDHLVPYSVSHIRDNTTTDFDLFLKIHGHLILYGSNGYQWTRDELTDLVKHGVEQFLVRPSDSTKVEMYHTLQSLEPIENTLPPHERIVEIDRIGAAFLKCLYQGEITPGAVQKGEKIADAITSCILEDPKCTRYIKGLADHDHYTYYHSLRVSCFSVAIAVQMGIHDLHHLKEVALGGIFHDIGKKSVPMSLITKTGALNEEEWTTMRAHPSEGWYLVQDSILSHVPREIILHHHEKLNGSGYPHGLDQHSLLPEVQMATVADIFDALTSSRSYQKRRTRFEALDLMKKKMLGHDLSQEVYRALIAALA